MRSSKVFFPLIAILVFLVVQCRHEPDKVPVTGNPCHPDTVYFQRQILPVLLSSCAYAGCHDANTAMDDVILDSYTNVVNTADVKPGNPDGSDLYEVLVEDRPEKRMPPPPLPSLPDEHIAMIRKWINHGAQDLICDDE